MAFASLTARRSAALVGLGETTLTSDIDPDARACTSKVTTIGSPTCGGIVQHRASCFLKLSSSDMERVSSILSV